tara:strand:- start:114 stop:425 length:312 start_codon:yes stop_codon:yes gene_type:complete
VEALIVREAQLQKPRHVLESRRGYAPGGLTKWFKEDWRDVKTGKKCGRKSAKDSSRPYPACRPAKVAGRISKKEASKKTGPQKVSWSVTASGRKRKTNARKKS